MTTAENRVEGLGRRDKNMRLKLDRIESAATALFDELGFDAVTTQSISDRADVAAGTLFRYAASKSELLIMVYNAKLRDAIDRGRSAAAGMTSAADAVTALVEPAVISAARFPENSAVYQRELLFGSPGERYRQEGLSLIADLEADIAARLTAEPGGVTRDADAARLAASSILAVQHLTIARLYTGAHSGHNPTADLRGQINQIVAGLDS
jgi:AcrR family transcriptional regulator